MPRLIAVDMGSHAVKVAAYRGSRGAFLFEERYRQPVPQSGAPPSLEVRLAALDALLDEVPSLAAGVNDVVALALPTETTVFHRLTLPFKDKAQVEKTLSFAIEGEVPFDLDDMVLGSRVIAVTDKTEMIAAMVRHDVLGEWIAALAERRLDPAVVYVAGELHGHWVRQVTGPVELEEGEEPPAPPLAAVLDVGHAHSVVSVVRENKVVLTRSIDVGGLAFTRAIRDALGVTFAEAEEMKHGEMGESVADADEEVTDPGIARHSGYQGLPDIARQAVDGAIGLLLAEVRSTMIAAEDELGAEIAQVHLTGGGSRIDELWDYLAADLGVPVRRATAPDAEGVPGSYALTHALAMGAVARNPARTIDFRRGDLAFRGGTDMLRMVVTYGTALVGFFGVAALAMFFLQWRSLGAEHDGVTEQLRELVVQTFPEVPPGSIDDAGMALQLMRDFTEEARQHLEFLGEDAGVPPTVDTLYELTRAFPAHPEVTVQVKDLSITPNTITFNAQTNGYAASSAVEEALQENPRFKYASKGTETRLTDGDVKFPITIALDVEEGEDVDVEEEG